MAHSAMPADPSAITPEQQLDAQFTNAYREYAPMVRRIVLANLNDGDKHLADDLMQETFLRIYRQRDRIDFGPRIRGLLPVASRRTVLDHYKVKRNKLETAADTGHWSIANRDLVPTGGCYALARTFRTAQIGGAR